VLTDVGNPGGIRRVLLERDDGPATHGRFRNNKWVGVKSALLQLLYVHVLLEMPHGIDIAHPQPP
jgi:hypothetical protein